MPVSMGLTMNAGSHRRFHPEMGQFGGEKIALLSAPSLFLPFLSTFPHRLPKSFAASALSHPAVSSSSSK